MEKTNIIKISREFKDNVLGSIWLGREITIGYGFDPTEAFIKANEELVNAYGRLSAGNGYSNNLKDAGNWTTMPYGNGYGNSMTNEPPVINQEPKEKAIENFIEAIRTSTTLKGVEIFRKLVERENNPSLTEAFENKLSQLK